MEKISVSKLEKEFNSNNDFNIESVIDLTSGKAVRKLLSNFSNYDDMVNESDKKIEKDTEYLNSISNIEKYAGELELKYLDKDNKVIDESNIAGKIAIREKKLKLLEEEIALIKEDGNEPSETKINNKKDLEAELAKLNNQKLVFGNNVEYHKKEISDVKARIEAEKAKKDKNSKKAREAYYKIVKLTEFCTNEIKAAKKELSKNNKALKSFNNKNTEDFTKLSIDEQKTYRDKLFELQSNVITAGEDLQDKRNKYLKILATVSEYALEEYPELKASVDPIISKLDSESKKIMGDIDIVDVIEIDEPEKEATKDEPTDTPKEEDKKEQEKSDKVKEEAKEKEETEEKSEEKVDEEIKEAKTNLGRAFAKEEGKKITDIPPRKFFKTTELPKINEMPERPDSMSISEYMSNWASRIDKGEAEPAFIDESRIDEKHSWMNADQARATGNLSNEAKFEGEPSFAEKAIDKAKETKDEAKTAIDKLIAKIKELNNKPIEEEKVEKEEPKDVTVEPATFFQPAKEEQPKEEIITEHSDEAKAKVADTPVFNSEPQPVGTVFNTEEPKVESEYTEFNKPEEQPEVIVDPTKQSEYVEFNKVEKEDDFIDTGDDEVSFVPENTEFVMEEPKAETPKTNKESLPVRLIVNVKDATTELIDKAQDRFMHFILDGNVYQAWKADKEAKAAAIKVKE